MFRLLKESTHNIKVTDDFVEALDDVLVKGSILLVTSKGAIKRELQKRITNRFSDRDILICDQILPNPEAEFLDSLVSSFRPHNISNIIALGGGSVIDSAKAFSALLSHSKQSLLSLLNKGTSHHSINLVAIPTTAGTGAEVTPFATIWQSKIGKKHSLIGVTPNTIILDANLTLTLPYEQTIYPAMDSLSHALESLWNKHKTPATEQYATQAITLICEALPKTLKDMQDYEARKKLQIASTYSGLAISHTRTAIAHAISYPLTAHYQVPHGLACSFTLKAILQRVDTGDLGLQEDVVGTVIKLITSLNLGQALEQYLGLSQLLALFDNELDASRAGNFAFSFDKQWLRNVVLESWPESGGKKL